MKLRHMQGSSPEAAALVARLFCAAQAWGVMLWDVPRELRPAALAETLSGADVYAATQDDRLVACAWVCPALPDTRVAVAHFCSLGGPEALAAGRAFLEHRELTARYDALLGVIPAPYRHARRFVRELGFSEKLIPGLCRLPERRRPVPGALVVKVL